MLIALDSRFRGNDVLKIDIYLPILNLKSTTFTLLSTQKRDEPPPKKLNKALFLSYFYTYPLDF
jgi:hypothetical protein